MAQAAASTCEICTGGPGEHYCRQCDQLFCGSCKLSHLRTKISKKHTFLSGPNINKEEKLLCTEHEEMFLFYCNDCDIPVCRICSVEKHSRHLMTDLTKSTKKLKSELVKNIETKITTSKFSLNKIEEETKTYREEVKVVIKNITEEGNYWKNLIDKKVDSFVALVQDGEQKYLKNMSVITKSNREKFENCQQLEKKIKEMKPIADVLLLQKLKKLKIDVDIIDLKLVSVSSSISYRNKRPTGTEIDSLFGELKVREVKSLKKNSDNQRNAREGKSLKKNSDNQRNARPPEVRKRYRYECEYCENEQLSTKKPVQGDSDGEQGVRLVCNDRDCIGRILNSTSTWHDFKAEV